MLKHCLLVGLLACSCAYFPGASAQATEACDLA